MGIKNKPPAGRLQENGAACACSEVHVAFMVVLHGFLCHGTVNPGGLNALMPKEFLHLLNGHSGVKQVGGACPAEAVRVDIFYACRAADPVDDIFQSPSCKTVIWSLAADKERRIVVSTGFKIVFKMDVGAGVEICHAFLVSFAEHNDIVFGKGNILPVKAQEFRCPYRGAVQAFNDGKVALRLARRADEFDFRGGHGFFDPLLASDGIDGIKGI